jgi:hypothetical protein
MKIEKGELASMPDEEIGEGTEAGIEPAAS